MTHTKDYPNLYLLAQELDDLNERDGSDDAEDALDAGEASDLADLRELEEQIGDLHVAANSGLTMIAESAFVDYARDLAEGLGVVSRDDVWPATCIDWDQAAGELAEDYSLISYAGTDYYVRD